MFEIPEKLLVRRKLREGAVTYEVGTVLTSDVFGSWRNLRSMLSIRYLVPVDEEYGKGEAKKREEAKVKEEDSTQNSQEDNKPKRTYRRKKAE